MSFQTGSNFIAGYPQDRTQACHTLAIEHLKQTIPGTSRGGKYLQREESGGPFPILYSRDTAPTLNIMRQIHLLCGCVGFLLEFACTVS